MAHYGSNDALPEIIARVIPASAQTIYRNAYNQAWTHYVMPLKRGFAINHHQTADRAGWAAVKRQYVLTGQTWVRRPGSNDADERRRILRSI